MCCFKDLWVQSGVSTLIRLLCGLQEPSSGGFTLYGIQNGSRDMSRARRRMGAVVETPAVYMDMTAEENLKQQYLILGLPSYDGIPGLLKLVGLEDTGKKKVKNFSMGMKQRLGIAVALAGDPDLLSWMNRSTDWIPRGSWRSVS